MSWRLSLTLEICAVLLAALLLSNLLTFSIAEYRRSTGMRAERIGALTDRLSALARLLVRLPPEDRANLIRVASVRHESVWISRVPRVAASARRDVQAELLLLRDIGLLGLREVRIAKRGMPDFNLLWPSRRPGERFSVAVELMPGQWLNAEFHWPQGETLLLPGLLFAGATAAFALVVAAAWLGYRLAEPLRLLSEASARMEAGKPVASIPETGPLVVRGAASAFNMMARRVTSLAGNQRALLASVGHDLRTPITSLRLRSEFIDDAEVRARMLESLDELQALTEAALEAARSGPGTEPARRIDVTALVDSICADLADGGLDVVLADSLPADAHCRPNEIRRAVRNLIENAVRYGGRALVSVRADGVTVRILVDDEGPGIDPHDAERAFEPFVRLAAGEASGAKGFGLGLPLARTVARAHGGDVVLANRAPRGLRAEFSLSRRAVDAARAGGALAYLRGGSGMKDEVLRTYSA